MFKRKKRSKDSGVPVSISGEGVISVKSTDILASAAAQSQLRALERLRAKNLLPDANPWPQGV